MILTRRDLREAVLTAVGGGIVIGGAFLFRGEIERYIGETATSWILNGVGLLYLLSVIPIVGSWVDIRSWERAERKQKEEDAREQAKWQAESDHEQAEYDAFLAWVRQNPRAAERLLSMVEYEQIDDIDHRSWLAERREKEGPNPLTDLPRLYDWLKARRDLQKFGIEPPL